MTAETEKTGDNSLVSHLYMRSISISGSSWNSLIFTVSDKILLRFLRSSSTWKYKHTRETYEQLHQRLLFYSMCAFCVLVYTCEGSWVFCISVSSSAYARMVRRDRLRYSSWKSDDLPTSEARDMVTCIFTLEKFWGRQQRPQKVNV